LFDRIYVELVCPFTFLIYRAYLMNPIQGDILSRFKRDYPYVHVDCMKFSTALLMLSRPEMNAAFN
jgi:hypothetical protein